MTTTYDSRTGEAVDVDQLCGPTDDAERDALLLAREIKRAAQANGWCRTAPLAIARHLLAQGVRLDAGCATEQLQVLEPGRAEP